MLLRAGLTRRSIGELARLIAPVARLALSEICSQPPISISQLTWHGLIKGNLVEGANLATGAISLLVDLTRLGFYRENLGVGEDLLQHIPFVAYLVVCSMLSNRSQDERD